MSDAQARRVLTEGLPDLPASAVQGLLEATGGWALLLRLANQQIAKAVQRGEMAALAAAALLAALRAKGPVAVNTPGSVVDLDDRDQRAKTVRATIEASVDLLPDPGDSGVRLAELGVFAEDETVPFPLIAALWQGTAGLDAEQAGDLCTAMVELSLITWDRTGGGRMSMHDVVRDYLRAELGPDRIQQANADLVDQLAERLPAAKSWTPTADRTSRRGGKATRATSWTTPSNTS